MKPPNKWFPEITGPTRYQQIVSGIRAGESCEAIAARLRGVRVDDVRAYKHVLLSIAGQPIPEELKPDRGPRRREITQEEVARYVEMRSRGDTWEVMRQELRCKSWYLRELWAAAVERGLIDAGDRHRPHGSHRVTRGGRTVEAVLTLLEQGDDPHTVARKLGISYSYVITIRRQHKHEITRR